MLTLLLMWGSLLSNPTVNFGSLVSGATLFTDLVGRVKLGEQDLKWGMLMSHAIDNFILSIRHFINCGLSHLSKVCNHKDKPNVAKACFSRGIWKTIAKEMHFFPLHLGETQKHIPRQFSVLHKQRSQDSCLILSWSLRILTQFHS